MFSRLIVRARMIVPVVSFVGLLAFFVFVLPAINPHPTSFSAAQAAILQEAQAATVPESYCTPPLCLAWSSAESDYTTSVAWGDYDGDGDLDLAVGNYSRPNRLYRNDGGTLTPSAVWSSTESGSTESVAWGDYDSDGDLDLAVGNPNQPNRLYRNDGGALTPSAVWSSTESDYTYSVAWGDVDGDGDLDLIVGNWLGPNRLYRNDGGALTPSAVWSSTESDDTYSVAWGDVDGDGDLDLAVGNGGHGAYYGGPNRLYRNDGGILTSSAVWSSTESDETYCVDWGDVDGDGDLDLVVGNLYQPNRLYRNDGGTLTPSAVWSSTESGSTESVAWGDYDGDGDLDLAVGNWGVNRLYRNDGGILTSSAVWSSTESDYTHSVAWGDVDGDGDLDLAVGNGVETGQPNRLYRNDSGMLSFGTVWSSTESDLTSSVAWGDVDGDGDLDLAVGNPGEPNRLHRNDGGALTPSAVWSSTESGSTVSVAWGDVDGDGDLDLATGNRNLHNWVYRNDSGALTLSAVWSSTESDDTWGVAWGDVDGDGDLDLAAGNWAQPNRLYRNDGGALTSSAVWSSTESDYTTSVAWGDVDGDGDLDLAVGNYSQPNRLYRNDGGTLIFSAVWSSTESDETNSVAWGDVDADGDLDLVVGNWGVNRLYRNDGGILTSSAVWSSTESDETYSVAWGDYDGDGDLDLAVGNYYQNNRLYRNDGGTLTPSAVWSSTERDTTQSVAWGDYDGDGDLDLAVGNWISNGLRRNGRDGSALPGSIPTVRLTRPFANADFFSSPRFNSGIIPITYTLADPQGDPVKSIRAWYSPDGGGKWYTATIASATLTTNLSTLGSALQFDGIDDYVEVQDSPSLNITNSLTLQAWVNLSNPNNDQKIVGKSPMGSGFVLGTIWNQLYAEIWDSTGADHWMMAGNIPANQWTHLAVTWQTNGNMIGYINGSPALTNTTGSNPIGANTNVLRIGHASWSGPHFVTGLIDDVRIYNRALSAFEIQRTMSRAPVGNETGLVSSWGFDEGAGNVTHDLTANHNDGALINGSSWVVGHVPAPTPYVYYWDALASGFFGQSDDVVFRLEAVPAISNTAHSIAGPYIYGSYASSTYPFRVRGTQVRVLNSSVPVSNAIVYDLPADQTNGAAALADGSGKPFHTDGQGYLQGRGRINIGDRLIALLPITVTDAFTLYYTNAAPNPTGLTAFNVVTPGVQVLTVTADNPLVLFSLDVSLEWDARNDTQFMSQLKYDVQRTSELLYDWTNGQAALGPVNIYYDRQHWEDADIRLYATNRMRPNAAQGGIVSTVITDPITSTVTYETGQVRIGATWNRYGEASGTLGEDWPRALAHELGHYALFLDDDYLGMDANGLLVPIDTCTGTAMSDPYRDDYSEFHYQANWSRDCANTLAAKETGRWDWATVKTFYPWLNDIITNTGPSGLPLAVTQIKSVEPITPATTLPVPIFYLSQNGGHVEPGSSARAILFQGEQLIDLGSPALDQVTARGARVGDRLCVFDLEAQRSGCESISPGDDQLTLIAQSAWQPEIVMTPVTSRTIAISVTNVPVGLSLEARLYSTDITETATITLNLTGNEYAGTFTLAEPTLEGYIHVWVNEPEPRREIVTDYSIGGTPARMKGHWARMKGHWVPGSSADGQIILYSDSLHFDEGEMIAFQSATTLPSVPVWTTPVGHGYRLTASATAPDLSGASISIYYAGRDVPAGGENWLRVYFWNGVTWRQLPTQLDTYHNFASAPAQGPGLYALMSSIEIPLYGPGWNLFAYPVQETRPITQALLSISGYYTTVYGFVPTDTADPWKVYDVTVPNWVNDLTVLDFGYGYWINVTDSISLYLNGASNPTAANALNIQSPPATYYGPVLTGADFTPTVGMSVVASINGKVCGQSKTILAEGRIMYSINVSAHGLGGDAGCGAPERTVVFQVGTQLIESKTIWDNDRVWYFPLSTAYHVYLPVVVKNN